MMKDERPISDIKIDVISALPGIGDCKKIKGSARVLVGDSYEVSFMQGGDVIWNIEIRRIAGGVAIVGNINGQISLECYRCIENFPYVLNIKLREHALMLSDEESEPEDDYTEEYMVDDGMLDLVPIFRDAICLALPSKRICAESCRGLCPVCGVNLNSAVCNCDARVVDVRLKPLAELKRRLEEKEEKEKNGEK